MSDILLPPWLGHARTRFSYLDNTGASRSPYNGATKTATFGGDRLAALIEFTSQGGSVAAMERAALISFLARLRGKQNRAYLFDAANRLRGSFPAAELLANNTFANGSTGWTSGSAYTLQSSGRVLRPQRIAMTGAAVAIQQSSTVAVTQYSPYVMRFMVLAGRGGHTIFAHRAGSSAGGTQFLNDLSEVGPGLLTATFVPNAATAGISLTDGATTGFVAGDYFLVPYTSLARCALADSSPNSLQQSDTIDQSPWASVGLGSVSANAFQSPDGASTAELLNQDTSSGGHYRQQSFAVTSAAHDVAAVCSFRAANRGWAFLLMEEQTGGQSAYAFVNLTTGAVATVSSSANVANARAFVVSQGNGWHQLHLVARKTNAATSIQVRLGAANADNVLTYVGAAEGAIYVWRAGAHPSSVPFRPGQTTGSATSGSSAQGSAIHAKGLPASTSGLLLENDQFEIITSRGSELKIVTAALNSDAAGLGYLQFEPPLRGTPADNAPIIVHQPMGRFMFMGESPEWSTDPGILTAASAEFEEV